MQRYSDQKGAILLIVLIVVVVLGLLIGGYFITQSTAIFPKANQPKASVDYILPDSSPALPKASPSPQVIYENPFVEQSSYKNPFEGNYENPFNNL